MCSCIMPQRPSVLFSLPQVSRTGTNKELWREHLEGARSGARYCNTPCNHNVLLKPHAANATGRTRSATKNATGQPQNCVMAALC
jgi:hypothetical protein